MCAGPIAHCASFETYEIFILSHFTCDINKYSDEKRRRGCFPQQKNVYSIVKSSLDLWSFFVVVVVAVLVLHNMMHTTVNK